MRLKIIKLNVIKREGKEEIPLWRDFLLSSEQGILEIDAKLRKNRGSRRHAGVPDACDVSIRKLPQGAESETSEGATAKLEEEKEKLVPWEHSLYLQRLSGT